ncbi:serine/threonine-protein phosphatase 6 regulatory subunit 3 isoform X2 [Cydia pomonella]|uniref:serine/threonine-protein phosphatase 6 regulatory subunit 3 isoform X2 n=1 Tax=Cydia pomonella TaxID=82600 RepID=UPI002ADD3747|nr:serine/threonine-protein phosphatase 6 regulatory subunit 3 isoform X2 [Cydia pomonella]
MFWSGNYIAVRELNSLLKEENVTLTQVLEADDVLQECKADNKALIQFLTRPDILAELVTLITEEPPKNVELSLQYRHATIACEVLTSQLPTLSDRLSMDTVQMHRLCDFINREPPLNPLLASYFSKTIEMLLDRSPKQDWYLYHIVCLRVLDFLKARRDFLPNLLRHLHTSAVLDALKCFIRLNDLFNKLIMEWLEEHQFLEALIAIICGTYEPPPLAPRAPPCELEKGQQEESEKAEKEAIEKGDLDAQGKEVREDPPSSEQATGDNARAEAEAEAKAERAAERVRAVAAANAAALLTDIILNGCSADYSQVTPGGNTRSRTAAALVARATCPGGVGALLQAVFTCPAAARRHALVHGAKLLLAMREDQHCTADQGGSGTSTRNGVELAVAPHLPLLHTALLQPPEPYMHEPSAWEAPTDGGGGATVAGAGDAAVTTEVLAPERDAPPAEATAAEGPAEATRFTEATTEAKEPSVSEGATADVKEPSATEVPTEAPKTSPRVAVGAARLQVAALLAALCGSEVDEVASTMLTLGTPGVLIDMFFAHPHNNFLHAQVLVMVRNALSNRAYRTQYARHILKECDLFNRLMDVYEENEAKRGTSSSPRAGYMGHVVLLLRTIAPTLEERTPAAERWASSSIESVIKQLDTPLGGYYPSENTYEVEPEGMVEVESRLYNLSNYSDFATDEDLSEVASSAKMNKFLELIKQRKGNKSDMWDDEPEGEAEEERDRDREDDGDEKDDDDGEARATVHDVLAPVSPWESSFEESNMAGESWAQFSADAFGAPIDPFANTDSFAKSDAFANDTFAKSDDFANDAFANDAFASDAFKKDFDGVTFKEDSFGEGGSEEFTPFWGYQDKGDDVNGTNGVEQSLHGLRLDAMDKPLDELSSSLADNLRTAMSSMTPEVIANIVNANMTPALNVPLDVPNASNPTNASNASNTSSTANEPSNTSESEKVSDNDSKDQQNQVQDPSES